MWLRIQFASNLKSACPKIGHAGKIPRVPIKNWRPLRTSGAGRRASDAAHRLRDLLEAALALPAAVRLERGAVELAELGHARHRGRLSLKLCRAPLQQECAVAARVVGGLRELGEEEAEVCGACKEGKAHAAVDRRVARVGALVSADRGHGLAHGLARAGGRHFREVLVHKVHHGVVLLRRVGRVTEVRPARAGSRGPPVQILDGIFCGGGELL
mmetsp:Transcript_3880/g.11354  ORF Transcript_3880/g.11354 Transcript_3880/m.11354 type:complete len:214 (-) Transcript_3880:107-748(-)